MEIEYNKLPMYVRTLCDVCLNFPNQELLNLAQFKLTAKGNINVLLPLRLNGKLTFQSIAEIIIDLTWAPFVRDALRK